MEIKTTDEIANYWDNTTQPNIDEVLKEKWIKINDVLKLIDDIKDIAESNMSKYDYVHYFLTEVDMLLYELSQSNPKRDSQGNDKLSNPKDYHEGKNPLKDVTPLGRDTFNCNSCKGTFYTKEDYDKHFNY